MIFRNYQILYRKNLEVQKHWVGLSQWYVKTTGCVRRVE